MKTRKQKTKVNLAKKAKNTEWKAYYLKLARSNSGHRTRARRIRLDAGTRKARPKPLYRCQLALHVSQRTRLGSPLSEPLLQRLDALPKEVRHSLVRNDVPQRPWDFIVVLLVGSVERIRFESRSG